MRIMPVGLTLGIINNDSECLDAFNRFEKARHIHEHPAPLIRTECINRHFGAC